jgi:hypothetical protein
MHALLASEVHINPAEVADAIERILDDVPLADRLSRGARDLADAHQWKDVVARMEQHWETDRNDSPAAPDRAPGGNWYLFDYGTIFAHYPTRETPLDRDGDRTESYARSGSGAW